MTRCADGLVVQACQLTGAKGNITLLWTTAGEASVNVSGLGTTVQKLDGSSTPIRGSAIITVGIAPVAVS
jgi:Ca2+-binding RTX toxin-like protein